ncbi:hypothetical protein [Glutamicibacter sp. NPDC127525]|uniref:hypothetical protein n=1 Tax=unclassified Glutamicibacter TaxID=2627139 RepID=UPI0036445BC6
MRSTTSASVFIEYVKSSEVAKLATLAAELQADLDMSRDSESKSHTVDIKWRNVQSNQALAALVLCLSAQENKSPSAILESTGKLIQEFGFEVDSPIGD